MLCERSADGPDVARLQQGHLSGVLVNNRLRFIVLDPNLATRIDSSKFWAGAVQFCYAGGRVGAKLLVGKPLNISGFDIVTDKCCAANPMLGNLSVLALPVCG